MTQEAWNKGCFTPRGKAKLCQRPKIHTLWLDKRWYFTNCNTFTPSVKVDLVEWNFLIKKNMIWHGPSSMNWMHQEWKTNSWLHGQCQISINLNILINFFIFIFFNKLERQRERRGLKFSKLYWINPSSQPQDLSIWENWPLL